jgi:hypothetical protein
MYNPKALCLIYKNWTRKLVVTQFNWIHIPKPYLSKTHFNITLPPLFTSLKSQIASRFSD